MEEAGASGGLLGALDPTNCICFPHMLSVVLPSAFYKLQEREEVGNSGREGNVLEGGHPWW